MGTTCGFANNLTISHRTSKGKEIAKVAFNLGSEQFQNMQGATEMGRRLPKIDINIITLILNIPGSFQQGVRIVGTKLNEKWAILLQHNQATFYNCIHNNTNSISFRAELPRCPENPTSDTTFQNQRAPRKMGTKSPCDCHSQNRRSSPSSRMAVTLYAFQSTRKQMNPDKLWLTGHVVNSLRYFASCAKSRE